MENHSIGKTIAALRKEKGWTQMELAEKLQVSDKAVSKWEKDGGMPSIEFFPAMAQLFGVSIDYLMTGQAPEKEIITMSKAELCAKNDDASNLSTIPINRKYEDGKTIIDYAIKYKSKSVIAFYLNSSISLESIAYAFKFKIEYKNGIFQIGKFVCLFAYTNQLDILKEKLNNEVKRHPGFGDVFQILLENSKDLENDDFATLFKMLSADTSIKKETFDILFSKWEKPIYYDNGKFGKTLWVDGVETLLDFAIRFDNSKLFDRYFTFAEKTNKESSEARSNWKDTPYWERTYSYTSDRNKFEGSYPFVHIKKSTFDFLIESNNLSLLEKCYEHNKRTGGYIPDDYDIKMIRAKNNKKLSHEDILTESVLHDGVICIDELLMLPNIALAKKILKNHPIHKLEPMVNFYNSKDWDNLHKWAINNNEKNVAYFASNPQIPYASYEESGFYDAFHQVCTQYYTKGMPNEIHLLEALKKCTSDSYYIGHYIWTVPIHFSIFENCKNLTFNKLKEKELELKIFDELNQDYFNKQNDNGNSEIVIIKLCVRLEAALKYLYHYTGTFEEMLNQYCEDQKLPEETKSILNRLRIQRNNLVHAEKSNDTLNDEELKQCITYICDLT